MNSTMFLYSVQERYADAFAKNFTVVLLAVIILSINGVFVLTFFRSSIFYNNPRYILWHDTVNCLCLVFSFPFLHTLSDLQRDKYAIRFKFAHQM